MIKFLRLKRIKKNYEEVYSGFKQTNEIRIQVKDENNDKVELQITDHQYGLPLSMPHVEIITSNCSYSMNWDMFIKKITN